MNLIQTEEFIRIGNGGGFAGLETVFTIYRNGHIEQAGKKLAQIKDADTDQLFKNITALELDNIDWNRPGNLYKFIEYKQNNRIHRLTWDSNSNEVIDNLNLFYNYATYLIQKSSK
jgi:hypothetical protein